jgi:hypothetical protein
MVGLNYHRIPEYLARVGVTELWVLQPNHPDSDSKPGEVKGFKEWNVQAVKADDWQTWSFWKKCGPLSA